jgi:hypothetical protein
VRSLDCPYKKRISGHGHREDNHLRTRRRLHLQAKRSQACVTLILDFSLWAGRCPLFFKSLSMVWTVQMDLWGGLQAQGKGGRALGTEGWSRQD